jgi:hypothetical protein
MLQVRRPRITSGNGRQARVAASPPPPRARPLRAMVVISSHAAREDARPSPRPTSSTTPSRARTRARERRDALLLDRGGRRRAPGRAAILVRTGTYREQVTPGASRRRAFRSIRAAPTSWSTARISRSSSWSRQQRLAVRAGDRGAEQVFLDGARLAFTLTPRTIPEGFAFVRIRAST